jgi:hypothetical protein
MHFKTRQHIRRAEEKFTISTVKEPNIFESFYQFNVGKLGRVNHLKFNTFGTTVRESQIRDSGEIVSATWPDGTPTNRDGLPHMGPR